MKVRGDATASRYGFTIEWSPYGGFTLYRMHGNDYVSRRFFYCTVKDACLVFRSELRGAA